MRKTLAAVMVALALAGCDSGAEPTRTRSIRASNPYADQLRALSDFNRGMGLRRAAQDSGNRCKKVESSGWQEDYKNLSMWTLRCTDGDYAIFVAPSGDVQVRQCRHMQTLGLPECKFPAAKTG